MSENKEAVHKVILSTKKEVLLREMKIKFQNLAAKAAGPKAGDNKFLLASLMQEELIKILIVQVDGKPVEPKKLENLDSLFTYAEYNQIARAVEQISGGSDMGEFQTEIVITGAQ